jgi:hypothetical protein
VPSRRPKLQDLDQADPGDRNRRGEQPLPCIGEPECEPDQNEHKPVLAILTEFGLRPDARRPERHKGHGGSQQPGEYSQQDGHRDEISRFINRISPTPT